MSKAWLAIGIFGLAACTSTAPGKLIEGLACPPRSDTAYYFPSPGAADFETLDSFESAWYSRQLAAMREPSLSCGAIPESYRFLWVPSFMNPIAVRISQTRDGYVVQGVRLHGRGGYDPGKIERRTWHAISEADWVRLKSAFHANAFDPGARPPPVVGIDGAQWVFEGQDGAYHVLDRWGGGSLALRSLGLELLGLADMRADDTTIY